MRGKQMKLNSRRTVASLRQRDDVTFNLFALCERRFDDVEKKAIAFLATQRQADDVKNQQG